MEALAQRILHRLRRALADLDSAANDEAQWLLNEIEHEISAQQIRDAIAVHSHRTSRSGKIGCKPSGI